MTKEGKDHTEGPAQLECEILETKKINKWKNLLQTTDVQQERFTQSNWLYMPGLMHDKADFSSELFGWIDVVSYRLNSALSASKKYSTVSPVPFYLKYFNI